jgi:SLT domain-containing protein
VARKPVPVAAAPLPPPAPEGHTVAVVRGTRLTEQQFVRTGEQGWVERQSAERK